MTELEFYKKELQLLVEHLEHIERGESIDPTEQLSVQRALAYHHARWRDYFGKPKQ